MAKNSFVAEVTFKVEVPHMASISKDILFHVSKFLEKMIFQLMFEIIYLREFINFSSAGKLFQTIGVR